MVKNYQTKTLKLNAPLRGLPAGHVIKVKANGGVLLDQYWRRRLVDAEIDNCVELVEKKMAKSKAEPKKD